MSRETIHWLNENTLIGYTDKRGKAWHYREGTDNHFPGPVPIERVERLFSFTALESPSLYYNTAGDLLEDPFEKKYYRSDNDAPLGTHKKGHRPHQLREWLIENVYQLLGQELAIGQAGLLRGGRVAWVSIEMADTLSTYGGVKVRPQLLAATSFDATMASLFKFLATIVVCDNTLAGGLAENTETYRVTHSAGSKFDAERARETLGMVQAYSDALTAEIDALTSVKVTDRQYEGFLEIWIGDTSTMEGRTKIIREKKIDKMWALWDEDDRVSPWRGTQFGVLQAANTYWHHEGVGGSRPDRNMYRAVKNDVATFDQDVLNKLALVLS